MATSLDEHIKQQKKAIAGQMQSDIDSVNQTFDINVGVLEDNFNTEKADTEQAYNELYDQNAVSRIVNERKIAENMAGLGLTDSGLNRTQQTANQLSYANTNNQIGIQKQKAIDTLALAMRNKRSELEIKKNEDIAAIKSGYDQQARSNAVSMYNTEVQAEATAAQNAQKRRDAMYDDYYGANGVFNFLKATTENELGETVSKHSDQDKADRLAAWIMGYSDVMSGDEIDRFVSNLEPNLVDKVYNVLGDNGYLFYRETPAVESFTARIRTPHEFARGKNDDNKKYKNYKEYVKGMLEKYEDELTDNEVAMIIAKYGLTN